MKKLICAFIALFICSLTSCNYNTIERENEGNDQLLSIVYNDCIAVIYVDNRTGVQYLYRNGGICVMMDAEGSPLIYHKSGESND